MNGVRVHRREELFETGVRQLAFSVSSVLVMPAFKWTPSFSYSLILFFFLLLLPVNNAAYESCPSACVCVCVCDMLLSVLRACV